MKIAVTGALGHIGSYIIRNLASDVKNIEFLLLDNFLTQGILLYLVLIVIRDINFMKLM